MNEYGIGKGADEVGGGGSEAYPGVADGRDEVAGAGKGAQLDDHGSENVTGAVHRSFPGLKISRYAANIRASLSFQRNRLLCSEITGNHAWSEYRVEHVRWIEEVEQHQNIRLDMKRFKNLTDWQGRIKKVIYFENYVAAHADSCNERRNA